MKYELLKPLDRQVSRLISGTMYLYNGAEADGFRFLDMAFAQGVNIFDSAQAYGESEVTLGKWLRARGNRKDVVVITKGCHPSPDNPHRVNAADLQADILSSLKKLGTDYIDVYFIHKDDESQPVGPLMETLDANFRAGRILSFGASN